MFNFNIDLGTILNILTLIGGGWYVFVGMQHKIDQIIQRNTQEHLNTGKRFDDIDKELETLTKVIVDLARQDERIAAIEQFIFRSKGPSRRKSS